MDDDWGFLAEVHLFDPFIISLKMFGSKDIQCKQSSTGCTPSRRNGINVPQYQWLEPHMALHISVRKSLHILDHCYCSLLVSNTSVHSTRTSRRIETQIFETTLYDVSMFHSVLQYQ